MAKFHHGFFEIGMNIAAALAILTAAGLSGCVTGMDPAKNATLSRLPGEGIAVYAAGDIADCRKFQPADSGAAQTARLIMEELAKDGNAAVLTLGDNTYPSGRPIEFTGCYEPTWGRFKARTYPAPGNHDYNTQGAAGYYDYFADAAGPSRRGYFSFNLGKWHVISLNSNLKQAAEHLAQLEWLKTELDQHKTRCTLAYWHHPVYSSGGHGDSTQMLDVWQILVGAGADVVLAAHDHDYERFAPQDGNGRLDKMRGIRQFVVGTGGARLTPFRLRRPNSEVGGNSTHGVLKLVLRETGYEWEFLPVTQDGFTDRGMALCH